MNEDLARFKRIYEEYVPLPVRTFPEVRRVITAFSMAYATSSLEEIMKIVEEVNR